MNNDKCIIFTISKFSGEKFDCLITTPDIRAREDAQTQCFSCNVLGVMGVLSEKYSKKGFTVLFDYYSR